MTTEHSTRPDSIENAHTKVGPCQFHGCTHLGTVPVVTNWPCSTNDVVPLVTIQGWVEERCASCAVAICLWPPHPVET